MEVHAHSHTARKKWTHYFWEFLMLFLAVFCGFLAEYQLEHKIEKDRAKELAKSLYAETYADSIVMQEVIAERLVKEQACIDFANYVRDSSLTKPSISFYRNFLMVVVYHRSMTFEANDGVLNQLINSGSLRYFKSRQLQTDIGKLNVVIGKIRSRILREYTMLDFTVRPFQLKHFDNRWVQELTENGKIPLKDALLQKDFQQLLVPRVLHIEQFDREDAANIALGVFITSSGTRNTQLKEYVAANHNLLMTLRKEYHLK